MGATRLAPFWDFEISTLKTPVKRCELSGSVGGLLWGNPLLQRHFGLWLFGQPTVTKDDRQLQPWLITIAFIGELVG